MYGYEQKCKAIDTYFLFDCSIADTVAELGYPNRHTLYLRVQDYKKHGEVRRRRQARDPRYTGGKEALRRRPPPVPRKEPGEDDEGDGISWQQGIPLRMDRQIRSGAAEAQAPRPKPRAAVPRTQDRDRRRPGGQKRSRRRGGRRVRGVGIRAVSLAQAAPLGRQCLRGERMRRGGGREREMRRAAQRCRRARAYGREPPGAGEEAAAGARRAPGDPGAGKKDPGTDPNRLTNREKARLTNSLGGGVGALRAAAGRRHGKERP